MKKVIAFDFDGTLLDSRYRHQKVLADCLLELNQGIVEEDIADYVEYKSHGNNTKLYLENRGFENPDQIMNLWVGKIENEEYLQIDQLYSDVKEILQTLKNEYDLILVTARNNYQGALNQIKRLNIDIFFEKIIIVKSTKNSSLLKYEATQELNITAIFGDTEVDLEWSNMFNVDFFPVNIGFRSKKWWAAKGVRSYSSIKEAVESFLTESKQSNSLDND